MKSLQSAGWISNRATTPSAFHFPLYVCFFSFFFSFLFLFFFFFLFMSSLTLVLLKPLTDVCGALCLSVFLCSVAPPLSLSPLCSAVISLSSSLSYFLFSLSLQAAGVLAYPGFLPNYYTSLYPSHPPSL